MYPEFKCPYCHSENIQSCPIIYQSGTSGVNAVTAADKFIAITKGKTMTDLARSVAPPSQKETTWGWAVFFTFLAFICFDEKLLFFGELIMAGYFIKQNLDIKEYNEKIFPELYNTWLHSYLCHRCGNIFVIN